MQREGWSTWILASAALAGGCCLEEHPSDDGRTRRWLEAGELHDEPDGVPCRGGCDDARACEHGAADDEWDVDDNPSCDGAVDGLERAD
ncbi:hypothetical protein SAMN02745121_03894 [Nannocystis exedens]|uniref:Lipoprotein n=1 Tax=Nannocystis exedens TaxID=54 RepID=A0A1I1ZPE3_9BACT|nr:hypothetical protein [Nannocystis exedens]PCC75379.1 hypothetical protein NAEX_08489 [Nannocystis exedens]SFE33694.1 hypothetical protein SAMN02745121_03894 [Nannocystis exedens]